MSKNLNYTINFNTNANTAFVGANQQIEKIIASAQNMTYNFGESWKKLLSVNQALEGIRNLKTILDEAIQPGIALNTSLMDLSAITGLTGKALDGIGEAARSSARVFGTDAAQNVESYKLLLSQLSPDIAKNNVALKEMGDHVNILSKTMGGDTIAATEVLTTAMNQYGISLNDPMQASKSMAAMMNVMAAAAKEGSAELPQIKSALEQVGMVAKTTGVTFSETNAAIQVLDKAGKKGAEGGVALRNTLSILSEGRFLPKQTRAALEDAGVSIAQLVDQTSPLTTRLNALKPIINDTALITKLFGKENTAAAIALINGTEQIDEYNHKIRGTNTAVDQAKTVMGSYAEGMKRITVAFDDFKISMFNLTQDYLLPRIQASISAITGFGQLSSGFNAIYTCWQVFSEYTMRAYNAVGSFVTALRNGTLQTKLFSYWQGIASFSTKVFTKTINGLRNAFFWATGAVRTFSLAVANIPVIGWMAIAVGAITAAVAYLWEHSKRFREILFGIWEVGKIVFGKMATVITNVWTGVIKPVFSAIGDLGTSIFTGIGTIVKAVFNSICASIEIISATTSNFFNGLWTWFSNTFSGFASFIDQWMIQPIASAFSGLWKIISGVFDQIWAGLKSFFEPILALWNKVFSENGMQELKIAWQDGTKKGANSFDQSKKKNKEEGEVTADGTSFITKLQAGKSSLKGFGSIAAASAKNTQTAAEKLSGPSHNNLNSSGSRSLTINKLVETLIVKVERLPESKERIKDAVSEALLLAVNDYNLAS